MNLQIRLEGEALDLNPNTRLTLDRFNPLFDFGTVQGSKVYPFVVPYSDKNNRIFQYAHDPQAIWTPRDYYTEKYADGELLERGFTFLNKVTESGFEIAFGQNLGDFFGDYVDVPLNLLPLGSEALPSNHTTIAPEKITGGVLHYCLPTILNAEFYGNNAVAGFNGKMNEYTANAYVAASPKVPMMGLHWLLKRLGELCGFSVQGEFMQDVSAQKLILYNTFSLDQATTMTYANHLPSGLTVRTLFLALKLPPFGVTSFFDVKNRTITMRYLESGLNTTTQMDVTPKTHPKYLPGSISDRRVELDWDLDGDDGMMKVVPTDLQKYTGAAAGTATLFPLKGVFSTLAMDGTGIPIVKQQGITPLTKQLEKRFKPRLLYWHGVVGGVPTAKIEHGTTRMAFAGTNNLRDKFWKRYEEWRLRTFPTTLKVALNSHDLARLDFHLRAGEEVSIHVRGVDYYVQRISTTLPLEGYATLDCWKK